MRTFIAGGAGFIGSHVAHRILNEPDCEHLVIYDNFTSGKDRHIDDIANDPKVTVVRADIKDLEQLVKSMAELLEANGIKYLAAYPLYFGGIALIDEPASPGDANVPKNIKIRVPAMKSFELTADALGYLATPLAWADTFTSMQTGIVDGAIGAGAEGYYSNFRDLIKYYLPLNDHFEMWYLYMNLELWNKLSPEEQRIIQETAKALEVKRFNEAEAEESEYISKLEAEGITIIEFTDAELKAFADKCRENVWPKIKGDFGAELFDKITSNIK